MCKQIIMRWLFCNKVEMCWWKSDRCKKICEKSKHTWETEMSGKMKRLKRKMEVQKITFNYFARPQPRNLNFFYAMMMMAIQKNIVVQFKNLLWVYGMAWMRVRFSRPEILFQSAPVAIYTPGTCRGGGGGCLSTCPFSPWCPKCPFVKAISFFFFFFFFL